MSGIFNGSGSTEVARTRHAATGYVLATLGVIIVTALAVPLRRILEPTNLVMVYLLLVVGIGVRFTRGAAAWSALLGVVSFDFFVIPPRLSLAVGDLQYMLTFAVMLFVGLLLAHLTDGLRTQAETSAKREEDTKRLYELAREFSGSVDASQVAEQLARYFGTSMAAHVELWWTESGDISRVPLPWSTSPDSVRTEPFDKATSPTEDTATRAIVATVIKNGGIQEQSVLSVPGTQRLFVPLDAPMRRRGVLVIDVPNPHLEAARAQAEAVSVLVAIALERLHYVTVAQRATVSMERERLRNTILSALSHDIRTPLTIMVGQADALVDLQELAQTRASELATSLREQAMRMSELVNNLLDMARLQSGETVPRIEWQSVEELVGASIAHLGSRFDQHHVALSIPPDIVLVEFDAVLMERVLCNLLENAIKFSPAGSRIEIKVTEREDVVRIAVEDEGTGLSEAASEKLFAPFVRGPGAGNVPGLGLGLSICRIIVEAHEGRIYAENRQEGGARFVVELPRRTPPQIEIEE